MYVCLQQNISSFLGIILWSFGMFCLVYVCGCACANEKWFLNSQFSSYKCMYEYTSLLALKLFCFVFSAELITKVLWCVVWDSVVGILRNSREWHINVLWIESAPYPTYSCAIFFHTYQRNIKWQLAFYHKGGSMYGLPYEIFRLLIGFAWTLRVPPTVQLQGLLNLCIQFSVAPT